MSLPGLQLTENETWILLDCVTDRLVAHRKHVESSEEPTNRACDILDTLQSLRGRLSNRANFRTEGYWR